MTNEELTKRVQKLGFRLDIINGVLDDNHKITMSIMDLVEILARKINRMEGKNGHKNCQIVVSGKSGVDSGPSGKT